MNSHYEINVPLLNEKGHHENEYYLKKNKYCYEI